MMGNDTHSEDEVCARCRALANYARAIADLDAAREATGGSSAARMLPCVCSSPWPHDVELPSEGWLTYERPLAAQMTWRDLSDHLTCAVDGLYQNATEALLVEERPTVEVCAGCVAELLTEVREVARALDALEAHFGADVIAVRVDASLRRYVAAATVDSANISHADGRDD